jgi:hypothetical protein
MKPSILTLLIGFLLTGWSCIREDIFELSPFNAITAYEIEGQAGPTTIDVSNRTVRIPVNENSSLSSIVPITFEISNLATISPSKSTAVDLTGIVSYTVTAEDGSTAEWQVQTVASDPNPQLANSSLDAWYAEGSYEQPGIDAETTIWGTANKAAAIIGQPNTERIDLGGGDQAARMVTKASPALVRIAAGTLFTGKFTDGFPSATNPRSNIDFGTRFTGRPNSFSVDYRYTPGASYEDANGNPLSGDDACDIYVLLERRTESETRRIATGWFRSSTGTTDWTDIEVPFKYGALTPADPEYPYANVRDGHTWGNPDEVPTHITVVFSSSAKGDEFTGAIGSQLDVNNFRLNYP